MGSGRRGPRPSCPSGSVSALARRLESPTPLRTTTREVPMSQLRWKRKKRKRKRRKKRKNKCFLTRLPPTKTSPPQSISLHHCFTPRATIITSTSHFSSLRKTNEKNDRLAKIKISSQPTGNLRAIAAHLSTAGKINNNIDSDLLFKCLYNMCFVTAPTL